MHTSLHVGLHVGLGWLCLALVATGEAGEFSLATAGARLGFSANDESGNLRQNEAFATFDLPWHWSWDSGWRVQTGLACTAGEIRGYGDEAFIGSLGPNFSVGREGLPVRLELGLSLTVMSRSEFGAVDLGVPFQFTSYAGVEVEVGKHLGLGYRFQHMSNAGLSVANPGLNLHAFSIRYRF